MSDDDPVESGQTHPAESGQTDQKKSIQNREQAEPAPEASFTVGVKKTRRKLVAESEDEPQVIQFEIEPSRVSSRVVTPPQLRSAERSPWSLHPVQIDGSEFEPEEVLPPILQMWEEAHLDPPSITFDRIQSVEIGLPPRPLLSVSQSGSGEDEQTPPSEVESEDPEQSKDQSTVEQETTADTGEEAPTEKSPEPDPPELEEFLFEIAGGDLDSYDPLCIVAGKTPQEEYKQTVETLCCEQFRQLSGGKPLAQLLADSEGKSLEETQVQNSLISYDDDSSVDYFDFVSKIGEGERAKAIEEGEVDLTRLRARIDEFFSQTLGYLLLFVDESYASVLYDHLRTSDDIREPTQILSIRPRPLPADVKRELVELAWGNVTIESDSTTLDRHFQSAESTFKEQIQPPESVVEITAHDFGEESRLHYWTKCLVVEHLVKRQGLTPIEEYSRLDLKEKIATEQQLEGGKKPVPDVYHTETGEAFEVETLYRTDHKKITRTIDKYEGVNVKRVNVVLPNLTCLRNLDDVLRKTQEQPGEMFHNEVKFWTLDVDARELLPLDEAVDTVLSLQERSERFQ